jgi:hypothetical protein
MSMSEWEDPEEPHRLRLVGVDEIEKTFQTSSSLGQRYASDPA